MPKKGIKIALFAIGCMGLLIVYYFVDPVKYVWIPKCPFYVLTGLKCPGCGSQRAIHAFIHGNITQGFKENLLLLPSLIYIIMILSTKTTNMYKILTGRVACIVIASLFCAYWIIRNIISI